MSGSWSSREAADIKKRLEGEGPLAGKHYLILWTGSNDLARLTGEKLEDKNEIAKKARGIAYIAKSTAALATERDTLVGIVVPPPRRDYHAWYMKSTKIS